MLKEMIHYLNLLIIFAFPAAVELAEFVADYLSYGGAVAYDDLQIEERPMPDDLKSEMKNKTDFELEMEDCMLEFLHCKRVRFNKTQTEEVCALHGQTADKKSFEHFCIMSYESCKEYFLHGIGWNYLNDGPCSSDIVQKPIEHTPGPHTASEKATKTPPDSPIYVQPSEAQKTPESSPIPMRKNEERKLLTVKTPKWSN